MFGSLAAPAQSFGQQQQPNSRFFPNFPCLNSQADGKVVCINTTSQDIQKPRFESRIEYIKAGRPQNAQPQQQGFPAPTNQPQPYGMQPALPQNQQPALGGGLFQQPAAGGSLFNPTPQQNAVPPFSLAAPANAQCINMIIIQFKEPLGGLGGLFGIQQPQQQQAQAGGIFQSLGQQQQQPGLFTLGQQPQQQLQQQPQFQPLAQQSVLSVSQLPQPPQGYKYAIVPVEESVIQNQFDDDALEQQRMEEMEQNFIYSSYPVKYSAEGMDMFNNSKPKSGSRSKMPRSSQINQQQVIVKQNNIQQFKNQYRNLSSKSYQDKISQDQQISYRMSQQLQVQPEKGFILLCPQAKPAIRQFVKFSDLGITEIQDQSVKDLILLIQEITLNHPDQQVNYQALFSPNGIPQNQVGLSNKLTLENLEFSSKSTITLFPLQTNESSLSRSSVQSKSHIRISFSEKKKKNPNAPTLLKKASFVTVPPLSELEYATDLQLSAVANYQMNSEFGSIRFLKPVDLRGLCLDLIVDFNQDSIEFYPEGGDHDTPPLGKEINVPCIVTFNNFGDGDIQLKQLKEKDFKEFVETVKQQVLDMNMKLIFIDKAKLVVELSQV